jgi:hypothetical protein
VTVTEASVRVRFLTYERINNLTGEPASSRSRSLAVTAAQVEAGTLEMPFPSDEVPYPDDETRESFQPTVTTPAG